ncbi:MAG: hypothetical protein ACQEWW_01780 [Bacillota bacterium]
MDELQKDDVIISWGYTEEIQEEKVGKKGWLKNYWTKLSVLLLPTENVIQENQKNLLADTSYSIEEKIMNSMYQMNQEKAAAHSAELSFSHFSRLAQNETATAVDTEFSLKNQIANLFSKHSSSMRIVLMRIKKLPFPQRR